MLSDREADILQLLVEDDYGLWEIAWRLGGVEAAAPVVERLCQRGLAELRVHDWVDAELVPVGRSGRDIDPRDPCCWREPTADDPELRLIVTETGRAIVARAGGSQSRRERE